MNTPADAQSEDPAGLSAAEKEMLDLEGLWWKRAGKKDTAIREKFDIGATIYYQRLQALIERPEALAYAPTTVNRLRRIRDIRTNQRTPQGRGVRFG